MIKASSTPTRDGSEKEWDVVEVLVHDGELLLQVSAAARLDRSIILGSPYSKGVLICGAP